MHTVTHLFGCLGALALAVSLQAITPGDPTPAVEDTDPGAEAGPPAEPVEPAGPETELADVQAANPYQAIVARNAFGLKDPPPPPPPPLKEVAAPVNTSALKLTGITTLLGGGARAMFAFNDGKTNRVSDLVREGEKDRFITNLEVLEIDAQGGAVKVLFGGQELRLDFVNNGLRPPTNMMAPGSLPAGGISRPGGPPGTPVASYPGQPTLGGGGPSIQAGAAAFNAGGVRTMPTRPSRLGSAGAAQSAANPSLQTGQSVTAEQQVLILQEQHRVAREQNIELPPAPPAPGLEHLGGGPPMPPGMDGPPTLPGQ